MNKKKTGVYVKFAPKRKRAAQTFVCNGWPHIAIDYAKDGTAIGVEIVSDWWALDSSQETGRLLTSKEVMKRLGFKHRAAFWVFVAAKSVPVIRLNARNIKFDPKQLDEWLASRSTKAAR